jgi:hypothetical protein
MRRNPQQTLEDALSKYEEMIDSTRRRFAPVRSLPAEAPRRCFGSYRGRYVHPAYGSVSITEDERSLQLQRNSLRLELKRRGGDGWSFAECDAFEIHKPHPFDPAGRVEFEADENGDVRSLSIALEPAVEPIRFTKWP